MRFLVPPKSLLYNCVTRTNKLFNDYTVLSLFVYLSGECERLSTFCSHGHQSNPDLNRSVLSDALGDYGGYIRYMATTGSCY